MDRSDFLERGELKVDFLKYYRLVSRWACKENDITIVHDVCETTVSKVNNEDIDFNSSSTISILIFIALVV